jgi:hypothetical protein
MNSGISAAKEKPQKNNKELIKTKNFFITIFIFKKSRINYKNIIKNQDKYGIITLFRIN